MAWAVIEDETGRETIRHPRRTLWLRYSLRRVNKQARRYGISTYHLRRLT